MKALKRTIAALMSLVIVGGAAPLIPGGFTALKPITASAEEGSVTFDKSTGTLVLSGAVTVDQVQEYALDLKVTKVYAEPGTVLPAWSSSLFSNFSAVTEIDLSNADSSNVTDMSGMFAECYSLQTLNLSGLDTRKVRNIQLMFLKCSNLQTLDLSGFDTSNVRNMGAMFTCCYKLESVDISEFDLTNAEDISSLFCDCKSLKTVDLCSFDTSNVKEMRSMFENCYSLETITVSEKWTTSDDSGKMFLNCDSLVGGKGTVFDEHHTDGEYARIDGGESNPGYFTYKKFKDWKSLPFDESTGTLTLTGEIRKEQLDKYRNDSRVKHITTNGTAVLPEDCNHFFTEFTALEDVDLSTIDSTNVTDIGAMFSDCKNLVTIDLTGFNTNRVTSMYAAFLNCSKLKTIYVNKYWDASGTPDEGVNSVNMFSGCTSLVGGNGTTYDSHYTDNTYARADQGASRPGYLTLVDENYLLNGTLYIKNFKTVDFDAFSGIKRIVALEGSEITNNGGTGLFNANSNPTLRTVTEIDLSKAAISNSIIYLNSMFSGCSSLKKVMFPADYTASNVTQMASMFRGCSALTTVNLNGFNTTSLQYTSNMFDGCSSLENIDLAGFDTRNVSDMRYMFSDCTSLKTIYAGDNWSTDKITSSSAQTDMFKGCTSLVGGNGTVFDSTNTGKTYARIDTADTPGYLTKHCCKFYAEANTLRISGNVIKEEVALYKNYDVEYIAADKAIFPADCSDMFSDFSNLVNVFMNNADTSEVTNMSNMFKNNTKLAEIRWSSCDTSKVTNMRNMFYNCYNLAKIDVSGFDTRNVTDMSGMFRCCYSLSNLDLSNFDTSNVHYMNSMFESCRGLKTIDISSFDTRYVGNMSYMFYDCINTTTITVSDKWNVAAGYNKSYMFGDCNSLVGGNGTSYAKDRVNDGIYAHIDGGEYDPGYFTEKADFDFEFKHNCSFQNDLSMYYAVPKESLSGYSNIRLDVSKEEYAAGASKPTLVKKTLTNYKEQTIGGVVYYMFTFDGITSTDMGSTLSAVLRADKKGVTYSSKTDKYSIKDYAMDRLRNSNNATFKKMLVDMLNYGAAAQVHFDKNVSNLANKNLTTAQKAMGTQTLPTLKNAEKSTAVSGATASFDKKNVSFENKTVLMYRLKFAENQNMSNVKLNISYKTSSGATVTKTIPASQFTKSGSYYIVSIDTIAITDVRSVITAKIYDGSKQISNTFQYSIESYVNNRLQNSDSETFKNLVSEMMKFGISAEEHFS
ncbi:MAG: BspA family leucine-rich repeat surface protein [Ruminococcus sp.]|nr:BspA family leucine-rich repeat surface protein [Ruminococcus sp.]